MDKSFKKWIVVCIGSVLFVTCFHHVVSKQIKFVTYSNGYLRIQDYLYYIIIAKTFWFDGLGNIYELYFQQQALSAYVGSQISTVMPLGITPIALVVWFPFTYVARFNMPLSYTLWVAFSGGVLFTALYKIGRYVFLKKKLQALPIALCLITIFSPIMFFAFYLGQTSVLAAGVFAYLIFICYKPEDLSKFAVNLLVPLLIFILGIKPTYLALGLGVLIIHGMWRQAIFSLALVIVVLICITPMLTTEWILSYFHQLNIFGRELIPDVYAWAFVPQRINIFRSAFRNVIGDNFASQVSSVVTCSVYLSVVGISIFTKIKGKLPDLLSPLRATKGQLFVLMIGSYLLFAPYAGGYEDVLIISVFIMVLVAGDTPKLTNFKSLAMVFLLFLILFHNFFPPDKPLWFFWILKVLILGYMINFCRPKKEITKCTH